MQVMYPGGSTVHCVGGGLGLSFFDQRNYSAGIGSLRYMEGLGSVGCLLAGLLLCLTRYWTCALYLILSVQTFHSGLMVPDGHNGSCTAFRKCMPQSLCVRLPGSSAFGPSDWRSHPRPPLGISWGYLSLGLSVAFLGSFPRKIQVGLPTQTCPGCRLSVLSTVSPVVDQTILGCHLVYS